MGERVRRIIFRCCAVGLSICVACLGATLLLRIKDNRIQQELLGMLAAQGDTTQQSDMASAAYAGETETTAEQAQYMANLAQLYAENQDFIGWLCIDGTDINYPVMYTPADAEYYLHKDFYGNYSIGGTVFASADCSFSPRSDNIILYGHNMANGTMLADLLNYQSQDYWQSHQTIQFDTLDSTQTYQILYAFIEDVAADTAHFAFYQFVDADGAQTFDDYIASCAACSLYDTGDTATYGDSLLTLVTCKGYDTTQRMVVVAKAVEAQE